MGDFRSQPKADAVRRIDITWHDGAYYVSIPNWGGGTVVAASDYETAIVRIRELTAGLCAAAGYLRNASIDLSTGCTKATAIKTIEGGLKVVEAALVLKPAGETK